MLVRINYLKETFYFILFFVCHPTGFVESHQPLYQSFSLLFLMLAEIALKHVRKQIPTCVTHVVQMFFLANTSLEAIKTWDSSVSNRAYSIIHTLYCISKHFLTKIRRKKMSMLTLGVSESQIWWQRPFGLCEGHFTKE